MAHQPPFLPHCTPVSTPPPPATPPTHTGTLALSQIHTCILNTHTHTHTHTHTPSFKWYVPCYKAYQTSDTLYQQLCQGLHGNSIIDLPLFNPRGHIEAQCKICWGLNSFQAMAHVSGNKSMHRQHCTERWKGTFSLHCCLLTVTFRSSGPRSHFCFIF